jgi:hypothetical protein
MPENVKYQDSVRSMAVVVGAIVLVCLFATAIAVASHLLRLSTIATEAAAASGNPAVIAEAEQASAAAREVIDSPIPPPAGASS